MLQAYLGLVDQLLDDSEEEGPPQEKGPARRKSKKAEKRIAKAKPNHLELRSDAKEMNTQIEKFQKTKDLSIAKESIVAFNMKSKSLAKILLQVPPNLPILATLIDNEAYGRAFGTRRAKERRATRKTRMYGELSIR